MSIYVMSDIHGEGALFHRMLEEIRFSDDDLLYILGDVIDRGPDGIELLREIKNKKNIIMLLGNHEYMMLQCYREKPSAFDCFRWGRNGNAFTMDTFRRLDLEEQQSILDYLKRLQTHAEICIGGINYYLVHGFPASSIEEEVWKRPELNERNPKPGCRLVIGHTPVLNLVVPREYRQNYLQKLEREGNHPQILFARGFIDVDCGCSYSEPTKTLGCLRLNDLAEYYVYHKQDIVDIKMAFQKNAV